MFGRWFRTVSLPPDVCLQSGVIAQGIAARVARRQASSEQAHIYVEWFPKFGALARGVLEDAGQLPKARAKL